ncbi:glycosyltransferase [Bacillus sp. ISL-4]|uniref:glycosyltransferase family 2 protein n=1 Tax=Bacillus sp. ISL-4 TaxID=2819125 RepID=UPI001BECB02F|nr:glycosyltransferase [Bacillus sp. ISL-4]MBT2667113.1 glycosyltransferase [Bacillus sp. ISL-4]MBT2670361.1 glycosyltransferase [Streptomyces sp. ISL-14]
MEPKVSIIIPFYNCSYIDKAIQSALDQTYKNVEVIVVDDGSTIFTEKIQPFLEKIRYLKKENGGTATALNHGIHAATGEYIAWLSSDDYFLPEKISKQVSFMISHQAEASFTNYDCIDNEDQLLFSWYGKRFTDINEVYRTFLLYNAINGCTVIIKKTVFEKVGYFNPYHRYTHDYEMWLRLLVNGHKMYYLDEALTKFRIHEESGTCKFQSEMQEDIVTIESYYRPLLIKNMEKL